MSRISSSLDYKNKLDMVANAHQFIDAPRDGIDEMLVGNGENNFNIEEIIDIDRRDLDRLQSRKMRARDREDKKPRHYNERGDASMAALARVVNNSSEDELAEKRELESLRIFVVAGETSGDQRASEFLGELLPKGCREQVKIRGMGGTELEKIAKLDVDFRKVGARMGLSEVIKALPEYLKLMKQIKSLIRDWRPNLLVLVDFPTFNLPLAKFAAKHGIKCHYHVPPKVWASRPRRIEILKNCCASVSTIFPFERDHLRAAGLEKVWYMQNPLIAGLAALQKRKVDLTKIQLDPEYLNHYNPTYREVLRTKFIVDNDIDPETKLVALFPGSREHEVDNHLGMMIESLVTLQQEQKVHGVLSVPAHLIPRCYEILKRYKGLVSLYLGESVEALHLCDYGILKSGTCNLEAALLGLPFVMIYKVSNTTKLVAKTIVRLKEFSIVNILKPNAVPELVQRVTSPLIVDRLKYVMLNRDAILEDFGRLKEDLHSDGEPQGLLDLREALFKSQGTSHELPSLLRKFLPRQNWPFYCRILNYLAPHKKRFITALIAMVIFGATDGLVPFLIKEALETLEGQNPELLIIFPAALAVVAVVRALFDFTQNYLMNSVGHLVVRDIRDQFQANVLRLGPAYFLYKTTGDVIATATSDILQMRSLFTECVSGVLRDIVRVVALVVAAIYLDPELALIGVVVFPLGVAPVAFLSKKMRRLARRGHDYVGTLSALLQENIQGSRVVKAFCGEAFERQRFSEKNQSLTKVMIGQERAKATIGPVNEILASLGIAAVIYYGGSSVMQGHRTSEAFTAFLVTLFLMYDPFKKLSRFGGTAQLGLSAAERVFEVLDTEDPINEREETKQINGYDITFVGVDFSYTTRDQNLEVGPDLKILSDETLDASDIGQTKVLNNINLHIPFGSKVAFVGLSGAGKSTLVDMIPRFIDPVKGFINLGTVDIRDLKIRDLRDSIALVSQHTFLFNDTLRNNVRYGEIEASDTEVIEALKASHAYEFVSDLPDGLDTLIGEGGFSLSGGQRQRIAIARALLRKSPILILDEATAQLDNHSEKEVQRAFDEIQSYKNRTVITIAHRLSTVRNCYIYVMDQGQIVEHGTHEELLSKRGHYAALCNHAG